MFSNSTSDSLVKNTSPKVVLPFYLYASLAFLFSTVLLFLSAEAFTQHYFHPHTLAITHSMALGWGTMIILGASHQLVPVLIEGRLHSPGLAYASFILAGIGIPLLVYGFYFFEMGWPAQWGGILINAAIIAFLVNLTMSMMKSKKENVHAVFVFTAVLWLVLTTLVGLLLAFNFTQAILPKGSLHYLSLHAHMGMVGWFLLLVIGVGSRLIPMFLISKYNNTKLLWAIYGLINGGLIAFLISFLYFPNAVAYFFCAAAILIAIAIFIFFCFKSFQQRIRKQVDGQMKVSLLSVAMMLLPVVLLIIIIGCLLAGSQNTKLVLAYGFIVFFGWLTAIIVGMTFKTLPFIIWNKVYHKQAGLGKTPNPKDLFSGRVFQAMSLVYLLGLGLFVTGILTASLIVLKTATVFLLLAAMLYNWNVLKLFKHKIARP